MKDVGFAQELKRRLLEKDAELKRLLSNISELQETVKALRVLVQQETGEDLTASPELVLNDTLKSTGVLGLGTDAVSTLPQDKTLSPTKAGRAFIRANPKAVFNAATLTEYLKKLSEQNQLKHKFSSLDNIGHTVIYNLMKTKDIVHVENTEHPKLYKAK